jgi:glyoxylase-like metal-dependent hydrolase (beta-lactamase superfamily II)
LIEVSGNKESVTELNQRIFQIRGLNGGSHSYVIKGDYMNVMIDTGSDQNFPVLERGHRRIGMKVRDINLVINSHEHCDHIGANRYFQESAMIAAYRLAASKMSTGDYYVTMYKGNDLNELPMRVHFWLENMTRIDLGNYTLRVFHTPGHTSGCISIIESTCGLLFSADSVFAGGTLSYIAESGSVGDYLDSLARLRCFGLRALYPGHGRISDTPIEDIDRAIGNAQKMLKQPGEVSREMFFQTNGKVASDCLVSRHAPSGE